MAKATAKKVVKRRRERKKANFSCFQKFPLKKRKAFALRCNL